MKTPKREPNGFKNAETIPTLAWWHFDPMMEGVKWSEKYSSTFESVWSKVPSVVGSAIATLAIFTLGSTLRGEWIIILVHFLKHVGWDLNGVVKITENVNGTSVDIPVPELSLKSLKLENLFAFWVGCVVVSYAMYFAIGGFLHWYFYVRQRDKAHEWKCQPEKWLSPDLERHEILLGSLSLAVTSAFTAVLACYISNDGPSMVYYDFQEYGWWWLILQFPVIFMYQDYTTYCLHRMYHTPWLYKHFHKLHHKYKQPTAFSVTAIHPFEILHIQLTMCLPLFAIPVHWVPFYAIALYTYYHGIIDHSGITFKAMWWQPWQPDAIFHDNHHQYFHVNFGFNMSLWDKIHGTYRRKDRVYTEDIYYGKGKKLTDVSKKELDEDIAERLSENPLAYRQNKLEFKLTEEDLKKTS